LEIAKLYIIPLALSTIYSVRVTFKKYLEERKEYNNAVANDPYYHSHFRVGDIVYAMFIAGCPVINIFTAVFRAIPMICGNTYTFLCETFDFKLIPDHTPNKRISNVALNLEKRTKTSI